MGGITLARLLGRLLEWLLSQPETETDRGATASEVWPDTTVKHLEFIQAVIARQASNGSLAKGWAITIAGVFFGFAVEARNAMLALTSLSTTFIFWGLDGYFLYCERQFRALYERVRLHDPNVPLFFMNATERPAAVGLRHRIAEWLATLFRFPVFITYAGLSVAACFIAWALLSESATQVPHGADLASPSASTLQSATPSPPTPGGSDLGPVQTDVSQSPKAAE
jgi:hypothetical protein